MNINESDEYCTLDEVAACSYRESCDYWNDILNPACHDDLEGIFSSFNRLLGRYHESHDVKSIIRSRDTSWYVGIVRHLLQETRFSLRELNHEIFIIVSSWKERRSYSARSSGLYLRLIAFLRHPSKEPEWHAKARFDADPLPDWIWNYAISKYTNLSKAMIIQVPESVEREMSDDRHGSTSAFMNEIERCRQDAMIFMRHNGISSYDIQRYYESRRELFSLPDDSVLLPEGFIDSLSAGNVGRSLRA